MFRIVLLEPEIPANTGNIGRLCLAAGCTLEIVGQPGFRLDERAVRRAGLDYWHRVPLTLRPDLADLEASLGTSRLWAFTTKGERTHTSIRYRTGDVLLFGCESRGLPEAVLQRHAGRLVRVPILDDAVRSLNLSSTVAIAVYEGLRQIHGWGLESSASKDDT